MKLDIQQTCVAGGDLYEELKRSGGQLKERRVAQDIIQPCLSALFYMHSLVCIPVLNFHLEINADEACLVPV